MMLAMRRVNDGGILYLCLSVVVLKVGAYPSTCPGECGPGTQPKKGICDDQVACESCVDGTFNSYTLRYGEHCKLFKTCLGDHMNVAIEGSRTTDVVCGCDSGYLMNSDGLGCYKDVIAIISTEIPQNITDPTHFEGSTNDDVVTVVVPLVLVLVLLVIGSSIVIILKRKGAACFSTSSGKGNPFNQDKDNGVSTRSVAVKYTPIKGTSSDFKTEANMSLTWEEMRGRLNSNGPALLSQLSPLLEAPLLTEFVQADIIRDWQKDNLQDIPKRQDRCDTFLGLLKAGSLQSTLEFCKIMRRMNKDHIADILDPMPHEPTSSEHVGSFTKKTNEDESNSNDRHIAAKLRNELQTDQVRLTGRGGIEVKGTLERIINQWEIIGYDDIENIKAQKTPPEKMSELIGKLQRCSDGRLLLFARALDRVNQLHQLKSLTPHERRVITDGEDTLVVKLWQQMG